jgi:hypothetical protein
MEQPSIDQRFREIHGGLSLHQHAPLDVKVADLETGDFEAGVPVRGERGPHVTRPLAIIHDDMDLPVLGSHATPR